MRSQVKKNKKPDFIDAQAASQPPSYSGHSHRYDMGFTGEKFIGGMPALDWVSGLDYWRLRAYSSEFFTRNRFAAGILYTLVNAEIGTGIYPESEPAENFLGYPLSGLSEWTDKVEEHWELYASCPDLCDFYSQDDFPAIQEKARLWSMISGDVLVILHHDKKSPLPKIQIISGDRVRGSFLQSDKAEKIPDTHKLIHGVQLDSKSRHYAYWVLDDNGDQVQILARGRKTGRKKAFLLYAEEPKVGEVRGMPLLSRVLQSVSEVDRYADALQRKNIIAAQLAMFIKRSGPARSGTPQGRGAIRTEELKVPGGKSSHAQVFAQNLPGMTVNTLESGEEPEMFQPEGLSWSAYENEISMIRSIAWTLQVPPEILIKAFTNNYSASQAALNEFNGYLKKFWRHFGAKFCQPIYNDVLLSKVISGDIEADGLVDDFVLKKGASEIFSAWTACQWQGTRKPTTDPLKTAKAYNELINIGLMTRAQATRELTGRKFSQTIKRLSIENEQYKESFNIIGIPEKGKIEINTDELENVAN